MLLVDMNNGKIKALHYSLPLTITETQETNSYFVADKAGDNLTGYTSKKDCESVLLDIAQGYENSQRVYYLEPGIRKISNVCSCKDSAESV